MGGDHGFPCRWAVMHCERYSIRIKWMEENRCKFQADNASLLDYQYSACTKHEALERFPKRSKRCLQQIKEIKKWYLGRNVLRHVSNKAWVYLLKWYRLWNELRAVGTRNLFCKEFFLHSQLSLLNTCRNISDFVVECSGWQHSCTSCRFFAS